MFDTSMQVILRMQQQTNEIAMKKYRSLPWQHQRVAWHIGYVKNGARSTYTHVMCPSGVIQFIHHAKNGPHLTQTL
jgi:hypothetical protein